MIIRRRMRQFYSSLFFYTVHRFLQEEGISRQERRKFRIFCDFIELAHPTIGYVRLKTSNLVRRVRVFFLKKRKEEIMKHNLIVCICLRDMPLQSDSKMLPLALQATQNKRKTNDNIYIYIYINIYIKKNMYITICRSIDSLLQLLRSMSFRKHCQTQMLQHLLTFVLHFLFLHHFSFCIIQQQAF